MSDNTASKAPAVNRVLIFAVFAWSLTAIPFGLWQLLAPESAPFNHRLRAPTVTLPDALPDATAPTLLIAAGLAGLVLARALPRTWPLTGLLAIVFGLLIPTMHLLSLAGYLSAFVLPGALVIVPVLLAKGRAAKLITAALIVAAVAALLAGPLGPGEFADLGRMFGIGLKRTGLYPFAELWSAVGGGGWAAVTVGVLRRDHSARPAPAWLAPERAERWGKVAAYLAFACALPYGLSRLTWLTPWPTLVSAEQLADDPGLRLWGLLLGGAALAGGVLCLGLVQRWGERWPYWMPVVHGRAVPPKFAIIPASLVAFLFTLSGVSILAGAITHQKLLLSLLFPMYVWGPALAVATLAYAIRRGVVRPVQN